MTTYRYYTAVSLDGFIAADGDSAHNLAWLLEQPHEPGGPHDYDTFLAGTGALVMGASTYTWLLDHSARTGEPWPYTLPCFVFTHRDLPLAAPQVRLVSGEVATHRAALEEAAGGRDVWVVGGGALAADLAAAGMLDELLLTIAPVTLGSGRPVFPAPCDLQLLEAAPHGVFLTTRYAYRGVRSGDLERNRLADESSTLGESAAP
ncbi:dihydrofolate reductase family protein [Nocardioides sp.]|uniref:dihydrofolate reductase family protein n=1 Tax=Nocardioides sp. TaxID=35761 RepID=UPI00351646BF